MKRSQNRLPFLIALLLVTSAALFALGTAIEHSQRARHHDEHATVAETTTKTKTSEETSTEKTSTGQASGSSEAPPSETKTNAAAATAETHSEKIAGIDPESWPLVSLAIILSLVVAAGVYLRRGRWLVVAVGFAILFAAADTRELVHQLQESRTVVATIAGILIALHLLAAAFAGASLTRKAGRADRTASVT